MNIITAAKNGSFILVICLSSIIASCGSSGSSDGYGNEGATGQPSAAAAPQPTTTAQQQPTVGSPTADAGAAPAAVTYKAGIQKLVAANCLSCHGAGSSLGDYSNFTKVQAKSVRMNARIQGGSMPQTGPLGADDKRLFQSWVTAGTPEG